MRFFTVLSAALSFASLVSFVSGAEVVFDEPEIEIESEEVGEQGLIAAASWPESNPFGHVVNGEKNDIHILVENKSPKNMTLLSIAGSIKNAESDVLLKNLSTLSYGIALLEGVKLQVPYSFYSEFKPGDVRLNIWLEHVVDDEKIQLEVFDGIVTVVEPEGSWFDFKLISTYLVVSAFVGGLSYVAYLSFVPQQKKSKKPRTVSAPVGTVTATSAGGYQEEWIPEHHLRKPKTSRKQSGVVSSGDELSGAETSGTEGRKRKGKK
ncbi:hypothetical protein D9758_003969 [Tetrapyrgos nigripes]|uniref:Translocon-associated protein subunit alpha n=1 Tax=Tetrapyrgos nigripes TaxID=182062 RepID=A0A8H5LRM6_9AGAR|nr:hypothetical protein D9758_003969 [Tetrapyrgos nigripes]